MDPIQETVKEIHWNVLESLSKVARFSRDTAEPTRSVIDEYDPGRVYLAKWASSINEASRAERLEKSDESFPGRRRRRWSDSEPKRWEEETEVGTFEVLNDELTLPPVHAIRTDPLNAEKWFSFFDTEGRLKVELNEVREAVFRGGIENDIRIDVWKFFLGVYPWDSSRVERENILEAKAQQYWALKREWWDSPEVLNSDDFKEQKMRIEKDVIRTDRTMEFFAIEDMPHPDPLISASSKTTNKKLEAMKDILMTYHFYNKDLGYVQGMSDLLAPVLIVMEDEVPAFWAFVGFMERMKSNFYRDQSGMRQQLLTLEHLIKFMDPPLYKHLKNTESLNLFFCFRWILIWFKREFDWEHVKYIWEVLWSDYLCTSFHLFVALAILDKHRMVIIEYLKQFDEILKYINDLSNTIPVDETLLRAETLFHQFQRRVEIIDRKRSSVHQDNQNLGGTLRRRVSESVARNNSTDEGSSSNAAVVSDRLPVISELLRDLLV
ncbi:rab-GTPase-TBC domain-containing protein [Gigaspora rosea]|uniref:GTPase-activating protein GYP7 n=1 Tax=Gigaspora rosea TaxID=44941 RepID=A0A397ULR0_9GLOM|nr:rab-GTPase-TBC domain-containing protein [Gigaspora rosea]